MLNQVELLFNSLIKDGQNCLRVLGFQMCLSRLVLRFAEICQAGSTAVLPSAFFNRYLVSSFL